MKQAPPGRGNSTCKGTEHTAPSGDYDELLVPGEARTSQGGARGQLRRGLGGLVKDFRLKLVNDGEIPKGCG